MIVTGSEGFIGKNLVARLERSGHWVYKMDTKRGLDMFTSLATVDVIYHLACINQEEALNKPLENLKVNAYGAKFMAEAAKRMDAKLIYTSTASVYGASERIPTPVDADINPQTDYAVAKLAGEHFIRNSGCDYKILRLSNVYGPGQTTENPYCGVIGRFIEQGMAGEPLTMIAPGTQTRDYTYIDDVIDVITTTEADNTTKNVSSGTETSVSWLAGEIIKLTGSKSGLVVIPERGIDGIMRRRLITDYRCPTALSEGLARTVEWYRVTTGEGSPASLAPLRPGSLSGQTL